MTHSFLDERSAAARPRSDASPLVSILIPAYNAENWIADTLASAVSQTWARKEIIVVDDGSTDGTLAVARRFASKNIQVVTQRNQGAAAARNTAMSLSQGSYIQWLDADDLLAPDKVATQMHRLRDVGPRTLTSSSFGRFLYRADAAEFIPTGLWRDLSAIEWLICKMTDNVYMQTSCWLVSRELTDLAGAWDSRMLGDDDGEYFCRVLLNADRVLFVGDSKVFYRRSGFNTLSSIALSSRKMDADFHSVCLHIEYVLSRENSARTRAACIAFLQHSLDHYYPARPDIVEQARARANALGGTLTMPRFSWKYAWLAALFGPAIAKRGQIFLPRIRWTVARAWDKARFDFNKRLAVGDVGQPGISITNLER